MRWRRKGKFKPSLFLLADQGFDTYSTTIETRSELVKTNPDLVQRLRRCLDHRLVQLSLRRHTPRRNALIKKDNPEMTDEMIASPSPS